MLYNKRGALTTKQIVVLIILIISFLIILFLIFRLNLGGTTKKEICRDSVILKGKSLLPTGVASLNCKTQYVCLSMTNSCDKIDNPDEVIKVTTKDEVYKALADKMADCWWMFGEGKINYVGKERIPDFYCSICSQLYFDSSIKNGIFDGKNSFSQEELYDYIVKNKVKEEGQGYDEYLYGIDFTKGEDLISHLAEEEGEKVIKQQVGFMNINLSKPHIIMMGITSDVNILSWIIIGTGAVASVIATGGTALCVYGAAAAGALAATAAGAGAIIASKVVIIGAGVVGGVFGGIISKGKSGNEYLRPILIEKDSKQFSAIECDHVVTLS